MKGSSLLLATLLVATVSPAYAAGGAGLSRSGSLVMVFLGFSALVFVAQLIPSLITFWEMLKDRKGHCESEAGR